jgi:hypothetical protein
MGLTNLILLWQQTIRGPRDYGTSDSGLTTLTKIGRLDFSLRGPLIVCCHSRIKFVRPIGKNVLKTYFS